MLTGDLHHLLAAEWTGHGQSEETSLMTCGWAWTLRLAWGSGPRDYPKNEREKVSFGPHNKLVK
jgi:hypothetical protein